MNILVRPLFWVFKKISESLFREQAKAHGYIVRNNKSIYVLINKNNQEQWEDITKELGSSPIFDEVYEILEKAIVDTKVPVKYICTKCKTTLVDSEDELISYGGLGNWCQECVDSCE